MFLFLSYAEEDAPAARRIAGWLRGQKFEVYVWQEERGKRIPQAIENAFYQADAFLALLSRDFFHSGWCPHELELALMHEKQLQVTDKGASFIRVLQIGELPAEPRLTDPYDRFDLRNPATEQEELRALAGSLRQVAQAGPSDGADTVTQLRSSAFRNRDDELERVLRGLTNLAGPHFWLVIAPPQLGKTWFMGHLATKLLEEPVPWAVRRVDLRDHPAGLRRDAGLLLGCLFGLDGPIDLGDSAFFLRIARKVLQGNKPYLCLLDSAELLDEETAGQLRFCLAQVYHLVQRAGRNDVRLGLLVASRRDTEWRGVSPDPRLSPLPLTEFRVDVVRDALDSLAREMGRTFGFSELQHDAVLVHELSEGLPALLVRCLRVVQAYEWVGLERLETQEQFQDVAYPYIRQDLLAAASLFPSGRRDSAEQARALQRALRALAPYRLFTQSHLRHSLQADVRLARAVQDAEWSFEDLWNAISGTALLARPLDEPWQEMQPAIRRLLYRYFYESDELQAQTHWEARRFAEIWSDRQTGKEQVIGLVECLWHEAAALLLSQPADMRAALCASAARLVRGLRPSALYTVPELRESAARRMRSDEELQQTVGGAAGLFTELVRIVALAEEP